MPKQFFHQFERLLASDIHAEHAWRPAVDIYRCDCGWLLKVELAGVRPEEIEVLRDSSGVTVSGVRRDTRIYSRQEHHLMEIAYSRFERRIDLPETKDAAELRTEYNDGMLLIHVILLPRG